MPTNHPTHRIRVKRVLSATMLAAVLVPSVAACGSDDSGTDSAGSTVAGETEQGDQAAALTVTDPWVKATKESMTAAFGTLTNTSEADITVVGAEVAGAGVVELHETVQNDDGAMAMQAKEGGFVIPAGADHVLEPGGDHVMLMELEQPYAAGTTVALTLLLDDGSSTEVEATVKPFDGADEQYQGGDH